MSTPDYWLKLSPDEQWKRLRRMAIASAERAVADLLRTLATPRPLSFDVRRAKDLAAVEASWHLRTPVLVEDFKFKGPKDWSFRLNFANQADAMFAITRVARVHEDIDRDLFVNAYQPPEADWWTHQ